MKKRAAKSTSQEYNLRKDLYIQKKGNGFVVASRFKLEKSIFLNEVVFFILLSLAQNQSIRSVQNGVYKKFKHLLSEGEIKNVISQFENLNLFEGPGAVQERQKVFKNACSRQTLTLSRFVQVNQQGVKKIINSVRKKIGKERAGMNNKSQRLLGALSPHGDMSVTGRCAAHAYAYLTRQNWPNVFIIIGTSHYQDDPSVLGLDVQHPFGKIYCDKILLKSLVRSFSSRLTINNPIFLVEHSWRQDLSLLKTLAHQFNRRLNVLPILIGKLSFHEARKLGRLLSAILSRQDKTGCLVASGDLTHYGLGYSWKPPENIRNARKVAQVVENIKRFEKPILKIIGLRKQRMFKKKVKTTSFCARAQVAALMEFVGVQGKVLAHHTPVNFQKSFRIPNRLWTKQDKLFSAASIAFLKRERS